MGSNNQNNKNVSQFSDNNNEINNLKNELSKAQKIIEQQNITIQDLQNKLNNYNTKIKNLDSEINNYKNIIYQNQLELINLKSQLNNNINNIQKNVNFDDIMIVYFISSDQIVHYAVKCLKTNTLLK